MTDIAEFQSYRPLLSTTLAIDYRLSRGLDPVVFHVTSFTLFAAQCLVLLLLYRMLPRMEHRSAAFVALIRRLPRLSPPSVIKRGFNGKGGRS